jgi:hypothetical protein
MNMGTKERSNWQKILETKKIPMQLRERSAWSEQKTYLFFVCVDQQNLTNIFPSLWTDSIGKVHSFAKIFVRRLGIA